MTAVGGSPQVKLAALRGDLILPGVAYGDPVLSSQSSGIEPRRGCFRRSAPRAAGIWGLFRATTQGSGIFAQLPDASHLVIWQGKRLVPLPAPVYPVQPVESEPQADTQGISLDLRRQLIAAAISGDPGQIVVTGGSLPESTWGEFSVAPAAFAYIAAHPWIRPLTEADSDDFTCADRRWLAAACQLQGLAVFACRTGRNALRRREPPCPIWHHHGPIAIESA